MLARQRTIDQDPAFAMRMLVDIAIRALSPAVNDPTTAVQALDRLEELLVELHRRDPGPVLVLDDHGGPAGRVPAPTWTDYLELAVTEIRHYGSGSIQVCRRLHALHDHLLTETDGPARARVELEQRLLERALAAALPRRGGPGRRRPLRPPRPRRRRRHPHQVMRPRRRRARLPA